MEQQHHFQAYTFSKHEGVSHDTPPDEEMRKKLNNLTFSKEQQVYAQLFSQEQCILGDNKYNMLGLRDKSMHISSIIERVHPEDMQQVYRLTKKAFDMIYYDLQSIHTFKYTVVYRMRTKNYRYIRILRETIPFLTDRQGKLISTISRLTDISMLGHHKEIKAWITAPDRIIDLTNDLQETLSKREQHILHLIAKGHSSKAIARDLCISKLTVDKHRANMLKKTGTKNTSQLIKFAMEKGFLP